MPQYLEIQDKFGKFFAEETEDFVERVISNLWIYRDRFGQTVPTLDAIAAGRIPNYKAID